MCVWDQYYHMYHFSIYSLWMINYLTFRILHVHLTPIAGNRFSFTHCIKGCGKLSLGSYNICYAQKQLLHYFTEIVPTKKEISHQ